MASSLGNLATRFGCELIGDADAEVSTVATLANAEPGAVSFLAKSGLSLAARIHAGNGRHTVRQ